MDLSDNILNIGPRLECVFTNSTIIPPTRCRPRSACERNEWHTACQM